MATIVGLRELKNRLSAYVREVRFGGRVQITDRGQIVAEIVPPQIPSSPRDMPPSWLELARQGKLGLPSHPKQPLPSFEPLLPPGRIFKLLRDARADRRRK